jgi:predicted nucleic acid-binding protein
VIVADAGVALTALGVGASGEAARRRLLGGAQAPHVLDLEVLSALRKQVAAGAVSVDRASLAAADLRRLPIGRSSHGPLIDRCWQLWENVTPYDASYVALAEMLGTTLVTTDGRLARAPGIRCHVEVLSPV